MRNKRFLCGIAKVLCLCHQNICYHWNKKVAVKIEGVTKKKRITSSSPVTCWRSCIEILKYSCKHISAISHCFHSPIWHQGGSWKRIWSPDTTAASVWGQLWIFSRAWLWSLVKLWNKIWPCLTVNVFLIFFFSWWLYIS